MTLHNKATLRWPLAALASTLLATPLAAQSLVLDFQYTGTFWDGIPRVVGWEFRTTSTPVAVTSLAYFDAGMDGLNGAHDVGLYVKSTQALVASATVPSGTSGTLVGHFRAVPIAPIALLPNTEYVIAGTVPGGPADPWVWEDGVLGVSMTDIVVDSLVTAGFGDAHYVVWTSTLQFPTSTIDSGGRRYFVGPNLGVTAVPEPSSYATVLALGVLGFAGWRGMGLRRQRR